MMSLTGRSGRIAWQAWVNLVVRSFPAWKIGGMPTGGEKRYVPLHQYQCNAHSTVGWSFMITAP